MQGGYDAHFVENWRKEKPFVLLGVVPNLETMNSSDHSQRPVHSNGSQHQTKWVECEVENPKHAEWESTLSHSANAIFDSESDHWMVTHIATGSRVFAILAASPMASQAFAHRG